MTATPGTISSRALENLAPNRLDGVRAYCAGNPYDASNNPSGVVVLAVAENKLMLDEVSAHINGNLNIVPRHLTYGEGAIGMLALRTKLAEYIQKIFKPCPSTPVEAGHLTMCNGASSALSNLTFSIAEPEEAILFARPLYTGFLFDQTISKVRPLLVSMHGTDPLSADAIQHYDRALLAATESGTRVRALVISNPHNPLGRPYTRQALEAHLHFCGKHNLHLISDEIFAASSFASPDFPTYEPFTSILSLDPTVYQCDPSLVHIIYGMSKDFSCCGIRLGCIISPSNAQLRSAVRSISNFSRASTLAEQVWLNMLSDKSWFEEFYIPEARRRLGEEYSFATALLRTHGIPYSPACYTSFIWVDLAAYLTDASEEAELALNWTLAKGGVWVAMGTGFGAEKFGMYRVTFAVGRAELEVGLNRLLAVLDEVRKEKASRAS